MANKLKIGDVFAISLSNGKKAYGQYLHYSNIGPIIQVFDLISISDVAVEKLLLAKQLFPPVITGLFAAIKEKYWKVIGNSPIENFVHPKFVSTLYNQKTGKAGIWFLWDGQRTTKIGPVLPEEYRNLEFLIVWNPMNIVHRIETEEVPFPYADLIRNNEFTPLK
jgi:hypothetical protein